MVAVAGILKPNPVPIRSHVFRFAPELVAKTLSAASMFWGLLQVMLEDRPPKVVVLPVADVGKLGPWLDILVPHIHGDAHALRPRQCKSQSQRERCQQFH